MEKSKIRKQVFEKRKKLSDKDVKERSELITNNVINSCLGDIETTYVLLYADYNNEVCTKDLYEFFKQKGYNIAYPKIIDLKSGIMEFYKIDCLDMLVKSDKGIYEPLDTCEKVDIDEGIIIVPLVAFDESCMRIGYGGGFYDRYLQKHNELISIGIAYDFQLYSEIEINEYDQKLDYVVTESKVYGGKINE